MITPSTLVSHIEWLSQARILCVGDLMLDRFVYGEVERTSPEAPVPILGIKRQSVMLGGVGNVARNLISIGAHAALLSVVGDDEVGRLLTQMVGEQERIEPHLLVEPGRPSTEKTRFVAGGQQLLRTDRETRRWIGEQSAENLLRMAEDIIPDCDVLVLSDYAKGVLTDDLCQALITCAGAASKPVVVDPKGEDYRCYRGASIITPNRRELGAATGAPVGTDSEIVAAGRGLIEQLDIDALLVTRSQDGMTLISTDGRVEHLPAQAREVFDVSGAGDTVVATLASALAKGVDLIEAAALANIAASVVVAKSGTAVVYAADLLHAVRAGDLTSSEAKIVPLSAALDAIEKWRLEGSKIGFTNGCFDLLHPGHISLLRQGKSSCGRLIVGLNSDASVRRLKGEERPVQSESARAQVLASLETIDLVIIFGEDTPINMIEAIRPDVLIKGGDYSVDEVVGAPYVQEYGGKVILAKTEPGFSTSRTIEKLQR
ncbi:MAG: Bifunctional protein HldE [Alphaproteobacteria bacterium MarineAlpha10_Bin1]|nr:MAG: Bifunctional protein HldE [Alphaproteobacteria bacterium MarineAlpha10_Bin1]